MAAAKPKIDLKARLGRKSSAPAGGSSVPPPGAARSAEAPGVGPSIPPPPGFGPKPPAVKPSIAPAQPAQQAIKVEMSEEVVAAQKRGRSKIVMLAAICAVVGLAIGFGVGQMAKAAEGAETAVAGAEQLLKDVDESNLKLQELNQLLEKADAKIRNNEYPAEEIEALGGLNIPFDGMNLTGKGIGRFNATAVTMLMQYANATQQAKDQKDKLRRIFGATKKSFEEAKAAKENPKIMYAANVTHGPKGPWAKIQGVTPFEVKKKDDKKYDWPDELEIGKDKTADRYTKGDPVRSDELIPVEPTSVMKICPNTVQLQLLSKVREFRRELGGTDTPGAEQMGTVELGDKVMDQLRRIGGAR